MCKILKISESGYYRWLKNKDKPSKRHLLLVKINEILSEHPDNANYGYDRIHKALEIRGIKVSRNTAYRAMKDGNLIHKARKPHGITKASTEIQDKENLIKRDFTADKPVKKYQRGAKRLETAAILPNCVQGGIKRKSTVANRRFERLKIVPEMQKIA